MLWVLLTLLVLAGVLLILPLEVEVDTGQTVYRAGWRGIFGIRGVPVGGQWRWFFRIFWFEKEWAAPAAKAPAPRQKQPKKRSGRFSMRQAWALAKNLWWAVQVRRLQVDWDTDDFALNARLYPFFRLLSKGKRQLHINFSGRQELAILLQARPYRLAWAFLRVFFHLRNDESITSPFYAALFHACCVGQSLP